MQLKIIQEWVWHKKIFIYNIKTLYTIKLNMLIGKQPNKTNITLKSQIRIVFNDIFTILKDSINTSSYISKIERWIISKETNQEFFENYFNYTHEWLKEKYNIFDGISVTKIILADWKEVLFSTHTNHEIQWKEILCLDNIVQKQHPHIQNNFYQKLLKIQTLEREFFNKKKESIKKTKDRLIETIK